MRVEGRTFVISGGASGLGQATASHLCRHGANVAILDTNEELGQACLRELGHVRAQFYRTDVTSSSSISESVDKAADWASRTGKELGGVIAASGIGAAAKIIDKRGRPFDIESFDAVMEVNVRGTVDLVRQVLPHLCRATPRPPDGERGVVVTVASVAAFDGQPGQVAYAASKGAIASLTLPMTRDVAEHGIRVVSIAPGPFETAMTARLTETIRKSLTKAAEFPRRLGDAAEFAALVQHVIENGMLNGGVIRLDGGMRMPSKI